MPCPFMSDHVCPTLLSSLFVLHFFAQKLMIKYCFFAIQWQHCTHFSPEPYVHSEKEHGFIDGPYDGRYAHQSTPSYISKAIHFSFLFFLFFRQVLFLANLLCNFFEKLFNHSFFTRTDIISFFITVLLFPICRHDIDYADHMKAGRTHEKFDRHSHSPSSGKV